MRNWPLNDMRNAAFAAKSSLFRAKVSFSSTPGKLAHKLSRYKPLLDEAGTTVLPSRGSARPANA